MRQRYCSTFKKVFQNYFAKYMVCMVLLKLTSFLSFTFVVLSCWASRLFFIKNYYNKKTKDDTVNLYLSIHTKKNLIVGCYIKTNEDNEILFCRQILSSKRISKMCCRFVAAAPRTENLSGRHPTWSTLYNTTCCWLTSYQWFIRPLCGSGRKHAQSH